MKIFNKSFKISATIIILGCLLIATIIVAIFFWRGNHQSPLGVVLGSLFAGLIVAVIQFLIAWGDYQQAEKLKRLELIKIMYDRDDRNFYETYINKAKKHIKMMGVTAKRFFEDFADISPNAPNNAKVLLDALRRDVKVQILLPKSDYIGNKLTDVNAVKGIITGISKQDLNNNLEVRYFSHIPAHSIFCVDGECIVGPVFLDVESKYTPALHLKNRSPFAEKYLKHFDKEWENANEA